jgi:hypothetical protein
METVMVTLKHAKAKKLLLDLEEMDLIQIIDDQTLIRKPSISKISNLKNKIITPMTNEQIDQQLGDLRNEWERNF